MSPLPIDREDRQGSLGSERDVNPETRKSGVDPDADPDASLAMAGAVSDDSSGIDVLALQDYDPILNLKMRLVNDAIDGIGWTTYHWKLFVLNGFGYAVDSMVLLFQSIVSDRAYREFGGRGYVNGLTVAVYAGMFAGALFWGLTADMIGRRHAFNVSLFICSSATICAGAMPSWPSLGFFIALVGFGAGGNLILDTTVFLEYLPGSYQWVLTLLAWWWGLGTAVAAFIAWGFLSDDRWNCNLQQQTTTTTVGGECRREDNWGWRFVLFTGGASVLAMSVLRVTAIRLHETPKYLLSVGRDDVLVRTLGALAKKHGRPFSLTAAKLRACGTIGSARGQSGLSIAEVLVHVRGLFCTRRMMVSTLLIWLSWLLIGLAYPLFYVFLPTYLRNRGLEFDRSEYETWRNYTIVNICNIPGPIIAGLMCNTRLLGRRYTMAISALATSAFFFAYTSVSTSTQDMAYVCAIAVVLNMYYGTLYAYTPEVLPSAHRTTGNGIAVCANRIMGILSAVVATVADTNTPVPLYVCAALFVAMAALSVVFPFEPYGKRSS